MNSKTAQPSIKSKEPIPNSFQSRSLEYTLLRKVVQGAPTVHLRTDDVTLACEQAQANVT